MWFIPILGNRVDLIAFNNPGWTYESCGCGCVVSVIELIDPLWIKRCCFVDLSHLIRSGMVQYKFTDFFNVFTMCQFLLAMSNICVFFGEEQKGITSE